MQHDRAENRIDVEAGWQMARRSALLPAMLLASCSLMLLSCATAEKGKAIATPAGSAVSEKIVAAEPQPGAVRLINGTEYIYARNRRWTPASPESEYLWVRRDQYSPGLFESLKQSSAAEQKELDQLRERIEQLEAELKRKGG